MKVLFVFSFIFVLLVSACNLPATGQVTQEEQLAASQQPTNIPPSATTAPTATPEPSQTPVPPTETPVPPTPTEVPPTITPTPEPTIDLIAAAKSAKIVLFEDMWYNRYVKPALDEGGYTYTDVGDKMGLFKDQLISNTEWDLVIAAAEGRGRIEGEFFDYILQQLDSGASVILEMWTLDWVSGGRIQPILDECGIEYQDNWVNPSNRGVFWADANHPITNILFPVKLERFTNYWDGDVGDLVQKTSNSRATIIGSANKANPDQDGLLTLCYDGRLLLQTFSTHDHSKKTMSEVWQNYIFYMLVHRFD